MSTFSRFVNIVSGRMMFRMALGFVLVIALAYTISRDKKKDDNTPSTQTDPVLA